MEDNRISQKIFYDKLYQEKYSQYKPRKNDHTYLKDLLKLCMMDYSNHEVHDKNKWKSSIHKGLKIYQKFQE